MFRARSIASGDVHGAPQSSTSGTRWGGLTGWPTRQRARPGSASVNRDATMAEVEDTSSASGGASRSSWAKIACLSATFSGPFSWTNSTSSTASCRLPATETRIIAPSGSAARPWRANACNSSRIRRGAAFRVGICGSVSRTFQLARAKIAAQARPIRPAPTTATLRSLLAICFSQTPYSHSTLRRRSRSFRNALDGPSWITRPRSSATVVSDKASARSRL